MSPPIVHHDACFVVVDKPPGMIVHRGFANDDEVLVALVGKALGERVFPVHRLDRATSGAVLFARDAVTAGRLGKAMAEGRVHKRYLALCRSHPEPEGVIDHPVPKGPGKPKVPAVTRYRRLGTFERYALVELMPITGRLHQLRRHMKHISCPLIGDVRYGKGEHNRRFRSEYGLERLALHAYGLSFEHPTSGAEVEVKVPLSGSLKRCLERIGLFEAARALTG
ncbi:MAG TPA: pseudouridine synthase [Polyangiaceae bacterium]|nr:pseudouridine synthase [Polyangiaceae bacterium]